VVLDARWLAWSSGQLRSGGVMPVCPEVMLVGPDAVLACPMVPVTSG